MINNYICITCGVQFAATDDPPAHCPICEDERQYVHPDGQRWTTLAALRETHHNELTEWEPGLWGIQTVPKFAIGQRPLLIQAPSGNILWDCHSLIDDATVAAVEKLGGIRAIAICHPHFYDSMVAWSHAFGGVPVYLPAADQQWVMRPDPVLHFWEGDTLELADGITVIRCGGHFPGSSVLHWVAGAEGRGVLLTGDTITVVADRRFVTFMYSYPNDIPLDATAVNRIVATVEPFQFDRIYGGWTDAIVQSGAKTAVLRSAERYIKAISG